MDGSEGFLNFLQDDPLAPYAWSYLPGGWLLIQFPELAAHTDNPPVVLAKTVERGGRRVITRLVVAADPVDSAVMKALPTGRLESLANLPWFRDLITQTDTEADPAASAVEALQALESVLSVNGRGPGQRSQALPPARQPREPLRRPDGSDPDGYYRDVAAAYNEALVRTSAPATVLAAEAGVPVPTARRWVAEARRRGLLPPGRKGRAG